MSCLVARRQSLCAKEHPYRQRHVGLRACRRSTATGNFSTKKLKFSQLQKVLGVCCGATAAQPQKQQGKSLKPGLPDNSELSPQLQQEWHPDNNVVLGGIKIKPYSNLKVMWSCPNCPAGCPHNWKTTVSSRARGSNCPYCAGRAVCHHNSLAIKAPNQTQYWNHDKNPKTPEQTLAGTHLRAEWRCPICSHEWQAQVAKRVQYDSGCPRCSSKLGRRTKQPTFEAAQHPLLLEWDYERNAADGIHPHGITLGSKKLVHWVCHKCPEGQLHLYQMTPNDRTNRQRAGCPYCAGKQVCTCNSLQSRYPMVSSEWDFVKNDLSPAQVTSRSNQLVWWQNSVRGSWVQRIFRRTESRLNPK
ncbi:TPA: hypothetical protein ACH3X2_000554 [Trebouxia sp. C0005]